MALIRPEGDPGPVQFHCSMLDSPAASTKGEDVISHRTQHSLCSIALGPEVYDRVQIFQDKIYPSVCIHWAEENEAPKMKSKENQNIIGRDTSFSLPHTKLIPLQAEVYMEGRKET